ncbi:MAG TPA: hypothetical protein VGA61_06355, partial [Anaerolineae bacterium]
GARENGLYPQVPAPSPPFASPLPVPGLPTIYRRSLPAIARGAAAALGRMRINKFWRQTPDG